MAGATIEGKNCRVIFGGSGVFGIGTWKYTPGQNDELDDTEFGDVKERIRVGIRKRGSITFDGLAKKGSATGQEALKRAQINSDNITNLQLYEEATDGGNLYLEPCHTTGYLSLASPTGNQTLPSWVNITSFDVSVDKNGLCKISFTGAVTGDMVEAFLGGPVW